MARRYRRRPDLDSPFWWYFFLVKLVFYAVVAAVWLLWAVIALPTAGIATVAHNDDLAESAVRSLNWSRRSR